MNVKYKSGIFFTLFGLTSLFIIIISYYFLSIQIISEDEVNKLEDLSYEAVCQMQTRLTEKIAITTTLSSAPIIQNALIMSNQDYGYLTETERISKISKLNKLWKENIDVNSPFIQKFIDNRSAHYLKKQQSLFPGEYGEIFLTNKYGVLIASTGKLTTFSHDQKYWWKAAYDKGNGRIFLDDRGYDTSANGVVLGVVIPIMNNNEVIGILKSNINIMGSITSIITGFNKHHQGKIRIARSNGLILAEINNPPLSTILNTLMIEKIQSRNKSSFYNKSSNEEYLVSYSPVQITLGSEKIGFGGKENSIDHTTGNSGESWLIIITLDKANALMGMKKVIYTIIIVGITFIVLMIILTLALSKIITKPIDQILYITQEIGNGNFDAKLEINSDDEFGTLGKSINEMTEKLKSAILLKESLSELNSKLTRADKTLKIKNRRLFDQAMHDGLTEIHNRRSFDKKLKEEWKRLNRAQKPLSLIIFDVDFYKNYNDTYGHQEGDKCLKLITKKAADQINRPTDFLARYGGDEFVILLPNTPKEGAILVAEKVRIAIMDLQIEHKNPPNCKQITISSGLTTLIPKKSIYMSQLIKKADKALYLAKTEGRNRVNFFD